MHPTDRVTAYLRTATPIAWGWLIAQAVTAWPGLPDVAVDALSTPEMSTAVTAAAVALWYLLWTAIEPRLPAWATRIVLGSNHRPSYTDVANLTADEQQLIRDLRATSRRE